MKPRILLVGVGRFGKNHLRVLKRLHTEGKLELVGAVVKSEKSRKEVAEAYQIPVYTKLTDSLLKSVDAVDIVTPYPTHFALAKKCLRYVDVMVEKPLAATYRQSLELAHLAKKQKRVLMVGHIYRFHAAVQQIKKMLVKMPRPQLIDGKLINPVGGVKIEPVRGRGTLRALAASNGFDNIKLEFLHFFDIVDYFFGEKPIFSSETRRDQLTTVHLQYPKGINARFDLGYEGDKKIRTLDLHWPDQKILCNLDKKTLEIWRGNKVKKLSFASAPETLETELLTFVRAIQGTKAYPDGDLGAKIVGIVESVKPLPPKKRPRVAIIGGGVFGSTCAIELGKFCDVKLFEKNRELLSQASLVNQYRHHWGYHYPRSAETAQECLRARPDFESFYGKAVVRVPSYYCVAKAGSKTSPQDYIKFCKKNGLPVKISYPSNNFLDKNKVAVCLKTPEAVYDYKKLKKIIENKLAASKKIKINLGAEIIGGTLNSDGNKTLAIKNGGKKRKEKFDYVINATYAFGNRFAHWFNFPVRPLRIDLKELLLIKLPIPKISMTVMDGPFATLVSTGEKKLFTLGHVPISVHKSQVPKDGLVPKWKTPPSRWKMYLRESQKWYPILKKAKYLESRFVILGVNAWREYDDARPSDITEHGFGCWSILGGKIVTCVTTAKTIAYAIKMR